MIRFMTATFVLLGGAFYHLSGGPAFAPPEAAPPLPRAALLADAPALPPSARAYVPPALSAAPLEAEDLLPGGPEVVTRASAGFAGGIGAVAGPVPGSLPGLTAAGADGGSLIAPADTAAAAAAALAAAPARRVVDGSRVNLRAGPGTGFGVLAVLERGAPAEVIRTSGGWAEIRAGGRTGWMAERLLAAPL